MDKKSILMRTDPAAAFHLESATGLQALRRQLAIKIVCFAGTGRQAIGHQIFEPHVCAKRLDYK
jgi:hypothetical protein